MAPRSSRPVSDSWGEVKDKVSKGKRGPGLAADVFGRLTTKRKLAMCAGLMASEAMGIFSNLGELPLQQTLGTPVSLLTLPGAVSAAIALGLVPLQGWLADGGSNPYQRKKPIAAAAFLVGFMGLSLNFAATVLYAFNNDSSITQHFNNSQIYNLNSLSSDSFTSDTVFINTSLVETTSSERIVLEKEQEFTKLIPGAEEIEFNSTKIVVWGLPLPAILSMIAFALTDLGFELTNAAVKAMILTFSAPDDHVSLLVCGVFVSALGGCTASVTGVIDLGSVIPGINSVSSQAIIQLTILLGLTVFSGACTIVSTPKATVIPEDFIADSVVEFLPYQSKEERETSKAEEDNDADSITLQTEVPENVLLATGTTETERYCLELSTSLALTQIPSTTAHFYTREEEKQPLLEQNTHFTPIFKPSPATGSSILDNRKFKLLMIWLTAFFSGCCIFTFNITITDFVGKVVFGGDPEASPNSEQYALYQQGVRTGSLCVLFLNLAYVTVALGHSKVLSVIGPKTEYIVVSLCMMTAMLVIRYTANVYVIYLSSAIVGLNRAAMYTVPFVLATKLCCTPQTQPAAVQGKEPVEEINDIRYGSMIAIITTSMPSAYLTINSVIGPLVDATGDPSAPMLMGVVCSLLAAITVFCYKS